MEYMYPMYVSFLYMYVYVISTSVGRKVQIHNPIELTFINTAKEVVLCSVALWRWTTLFNAVSALYESSND